ncbi:hypothetical protein, partial [Burkholderia cenocepacia]|uniref:hypothetical protein n=1 Tax=Burkholderia cenocepacia TaxID=95486 RepID=UPI001B8EBAC9
GCGLTITSAQIWHWAALPRSSGWPWPLSFYFCRLWKTGALPDGRAPLNLGKEWFSIDATLCASFAEQVGRYSHARALNRRNLIENHSERDTV